MPLVRIDLNEGRSDSEIKTIMDTIQDCVVDAFNVPKRDRYQIVTEHKSGRMVLLDTGLGFERSEDAIVIQVFTSPRATVMKTKFYKEVTERLGSAIGLSPKDILISVTTNTDVDWSFGFGESQYLTGSL
ncbi:tautomerase family protein [Oleiagrimonas citrea]|jgi:phenylpyruvate tautomerase PptA (4-oxalocrotonate tautomerase family)|uniref:Tautomerase family protein n=1 Tax=Oleiagrimonas citrea TaxID=1665687 RepID=A0A846ZNA1_9GAMM|nr:tautomerase family protein [Oleiagrimonas citrea]NKZ39147.1 tautomerase family protein [Oleiagrimonas citrea]